MVSSKLLVVLALVAITAAHDFEAAQNVETDHNDEAQHHSEEHHHEHEISNILPGVAALNAQGLEGVLNLVALIVNVVIISIIGRSQIILNSAHTVPSSNLPAANTLNTATLASIVTNLVDQLIG